MSVGLKGVRDLNEIGVLEDISRDMRTKAEVGALFGVNLAALIGAFATVMIGSWIVMTGRRIGLTGRGIILTGWRMVLVDRRIVLNGSRVVLNWWGAVFGIFPEG